MSFAEYFVRQLFSLSRLIQQKGDIFLTILRIYSRLSLPELHILHCREYYFAPGSLKVTPKSSFPKG